MGNLVNFRQIEQPHFTALKQRGTVPQHFTALKQWGTVPHYVTVLKRIKCSILHITEKAWVRKHV